MAVYQPAHYPRQPKLTTPLSKAQYQAQVLYYRYELITGQYVMSPGEKLAYNLICISILTLFFSAIIYYLPPALLASMHRLVYYFTGMHKIQVDYVLQQSILDSSTCLMPIDGVSNTTSVMQSSFESLIENL